MSNQRDYALAKTDFHGFYARTHGHGQLEQPLNRNQSSVLYRAFRARDGAIACLKVGRGKGDSVEAEADMFKLLKTCKSVPAMYAGGRVTSPRNRNGETFSFGFVVLSLATKSLEDVFANGRRAAKCVGFKDQTLVAIGLLSAVSELHRHEVLHLNIRPNNVLFYVGEAPALKLCDLEAAKKIGHFPPGTVNKGGSSYKAVSTFEGRPTVWSDLESVVYVLISVAANGIDPFPWLTRDKSFPPAEAQAKKIATPLKVIAKGMPPAVLALLHDARAGISMPNYGNYIHEFSKMISTDQVVEGFDFLM